MNRIDMILEENFDSENLTFLPSWPYIDLPLGKT